MSGQLPVGQVTSLQGVVTVTECRQGLGAGTSSDPLGEAEHVSRIVAALHRAKPIRCRFRVGGASSFASFPGQSRQTGVHMNRAHRHWGRCDGASGGGPNGR